MERSPVTWGFVAPPLLSPMGGLIHARVGWGKGERTGPLAKEMVTHSSILAWRISRPEEPPGLQSMGSQRVGPDWACTHANHSVKTRLLSILFDQNFLDPWPLNAFVHSCPHIAIFIATMIIWLMANFLFLWVKWWKTYLYTNILFSQKKNHIPVSWITRPNDMSIKLIYVTKCT